MTNISDIKTFEVRPSTLLIDCKIPGQDRSTITYELRLEFFELWERINGDPWVKVDVPNRAHDFNVINGFNPLDDTPEYRKRLEVSGRFFSALITPGDVYEVRVFVRSQSDFDPNIDGANQFITTLDVFALCSEPKKTSFLNDFSAEIGGTYYFITSVTSAPTRMKSWIGETPPITLSNGQQDLKSPTSSVTTTSIATVHIHELTPLLPGTPYHILIRLSDIKGNWQFVNLTNTTKRRLATVFFDKLYIINDSDSASDGNAYYYFKIIEGTSIVFNRRYPGRGEKILGDGASVSLPSTLGQYLGPKRVFPGQGAILVAVRGFDVDRFWPFPDSEETASNYEEGFGLDGAALEIPFGRWGEVVLNGRKTLHAKPETVDNEFEFLVEVGYTITYL
jgi:hypothetical protein